MTSESAVSKNQIMDSFLASPESDVVFEESDDEVVVVNLNEGVYYFLGGPAAFVWMALHSGMSGSDVVATVASLENVPPSMPEEVLAFVVRLMDLNLLRVVREPLNPGQLTPSVFEYFREGYQVPELETYSDLQDILLLDPIHDVDDTGWPASKHG